jgi:hypothetical protein
MISPPSFSLLSTKEKDALILQLLARLEALERENAALREKLNLPPKTPDNSSTPPAAGHKSNGETTHRPRARHMSGRIESCIQTRPGIAMFQRVTASIAGRMSQASHRSPFTPMTGSRFPEIKPDVTRVILHGGVCPCCTKTFMAPAPAGLEPGSPFGPRRSSRTLYDRPPVQVQEHRFMRPAIGIDDRAVMAAAGGAVDQQVTDAMRADMAERHGRAAIRLRSSLGRRVVVGIAVAHRSL